MSLLGAESNTDSDDENSSESSSSSSEDEEEEDERRREEEKEQTTRNSRSSTSPQKRARGRHVEDLEPTKEESRSNRRPRQQFKSRRRPSGGGSKSQQASRSKRKPKAPPPRLRLDSGGGAYSSTSEADFPINGTSNALGRGVGRVSREVSKCSSVYETANEGYLSIEEKRMTSPLSDCVPGGIPKATGIEGLTARHLSVPQKQNQGGPARGNKRKRSSAGASLDKSRKKCRLESGSSADGGPMSKSKSINGLVNGSGAVEIKPLDLVWAKCRGYPPYPALVSGLHYIACIVTW